MKLNNFNQKYKKGSIMDFFYLPALLLFIVVALFVSYKTTMAVENSGLFSNSTNANNALQSSKQSLLKMDNLMVFVLLGTSLFVMISSYLSAQHPFMFFFAVLLLGIAIMVSALMSNAYQTMAMTEGLSSEASVFPKIDFIMDNLPLYIVFMGFLTAILGFVGYTKYG